MTSAVPDVASVVLVTGIQAAGKSTVARLLAERLGRAAHIEGDVLWKMVVGGRADMTPDPTPEAHRQLHLRYTNAALLADAYVAAGFHAVHSDIVLDQDLLRYGELVRSRPLRIVVLAPRSEVVAERERARGSSAYRDYLRGRTLLEAVSEFQRWLEASPHIGLWLDTSDLSAPETVDLVLERFDDAIVED